MEGLADSLSSDSSGVVFPVDKDPIVHGWWGAFPGVISGGVVEPSIVDHGSCFSKERGKHFCGVASVKEVAVECSGSRDEVTSHAVLNCVASESTED